MERTAREIVRHALQLARDIEARAVVVYADAMTGSDELGHLVQAVDFPTILVSGGRRGLDIELDPADLVRLTKALSAAIAAG